MMLNRFAIYSWFLKYTKITLAQQTINAQFHFSTIVGTNVSRVLNRAPNNIFHRYTQNRNRIQNPGKQVSNISQTNIYSSTWLLFCIFSILKKKNIPPFYSIIFLPVLKISRARNHFCLVYLFGIASL